jgi:hypothetical protein
MKRRQIRVNEGLLNDAKTMYEAQMEEKLKVGQVADISLAHCLGKEVIVKRKKRRLIICTS